MAMNDKTFSQALTFTRASTKWVFDSTGTLVEVPIDTPAYDHDPVTGEPLGVLIEGSRTNTLLNSGVAPWGGSNSYDDTISADVAEAPDGTVTADRIVQSVAIHSRFQYSLPSYSAGTHFTISYFFKREDGRPPSTHPLRFFNTENLTLIESYTEESGNGFFRYVAVFEYTTTGSATMRLYFTDMDNIGDSCLIWGAQLEEGSTPSSYIPTAGAAVTRDADTVSRSLGAEFNNDNFTFVFHAKSKNTTLTNGVVFNQTSFSTLYRAWLYWSNVDNDVQFITADGGGSKSLLSSSIMGEERKIAVSVTNRTSAVLAVNGLVEASKAVSVPTGLKEAKFGSGGSGGPLTANIHSYHYYPYAMTAQELEALTTL